MSHKRLKSKKKENKKLTKKNKKLVKLLIDKDVYNQIFEFLEIKDQILKLSRNLRYQIYNFSWPKISIDISEISDPELSKKINNEINQWIEKEFVEINNKYLVLPAVPYVIGLKELVYAWLIDINNFIKSLKYTQNVSDKKKKEAIYLHNVLSEINSKISPVLEKIYIKYAKSIETVAGSVINVYFNFENGLYPELSIKRTENQKPFPVIKACKVNIRKENLKTEEGERNAYRAHKITMIDLSPIFFEPNVIGNLNKIPVYIQDHALLRLKERVNLKPEGYLLDSLGVSLSSPKVAGRDGDSYLIDFNLYKYKLGYLLVRKDKDFALVKSFKFITMTGTPEFNKIAKTFRATKYDLTYLGLDTLDVFMSSDLSKDKELRRIFEKCDLGHLFELSDMIQTNKEIIFQSSKQSIADEIKKYFKL